jgi:hypothetical protein
MLSTVCSAMRTLSPHTHFPLQTHQEHFLTITKELMENSSPFIPIQDGEMVTLEDDSLKYIRDAK